MPQLMLGYIDDEDMFYPDDIDQELVGELSCACMACEECAERLSEWAFPMEMEAT